MASVIDAPEIAERYKLEGRIAVGGMAEVFRAVALGAHGFRKPIAIKRILPSLARSAEFERRFIAEAKIAAELTHANIVQVLDFGRTEGSLYIAMEFIDGVDARTLIKSRTKDSPLPPIVAIQTILEILKGLGFAHQRGVVHRDISPSNILLSKSGEVKVADFGIAKAVGSNTTRTHQVMGKWRYMSPEQTLGESLDARSDLFSAGAVAHELFSGRPLFPGKNIEEIVDNIRSMEIPPLVDPTRGLPGELDDMLATALARDPSRRFATANDMLRPLMEVCYANRWLPSASDVAAVVAESSNASEDEGRRCDALVQHALRGAAEPANTRRTVAGKPLSGALQPPEAGTPDITGTVFSIGQRTQEGIAEWRAEPGPVDTSNTAATAADPPPLRAPTAPTPARSRRWIAPALIGLFVALAFVVWKLGRPAPDRADSAALDSPAAGEVPLASQPATVVIPVMDAAVLESNEGAGGPADAGKQNAVFSVTTRPRKVNVLVDGTSVGTTPLSMNLPADGKRHRIDLRRRGYRLQRHSISLHPGTPVELRATLEREVTHGTINLWVDPWANVYFQGKKVAEAPVQRLRLPVGRHRLRLANPTLGRSRWVTVTVPRKATYKFSL